MSLVVSIELGILERLLVINWRKVWMMLSYYVFYILGYTRTIMLRIKGSKFVRVSKFYKLWLSLDCRL